MYHKAIYGILNVANCESCITGPCAPSTGFRTIRQPRSWVAFYGRFFVLHIDDLRLLC